MANSNEAILPKWIVAKKTGANDSLGLDIGLGPKVHIKSVEGIDTTVAIVCLDSGQASGGIVGARKDAAIKLTIADTAANRLTLIRDLTRWVARGITSDMLAKVNARVLELDGDVTAIETQIPSGIDISAVDIDEDLSS